MKDEYYQELKQEIRQLREENDALKAEIAKLQAELHKPSKAGRKMFDQNGTAIQSISEVDRCREIPGRDYGSYADQHSYLLPISKNVSGIGRRGSVDHRYSDYGTVPDHAVGKEKLWEQCESEIYWSQCSNPL